MPATSHSICLTLPTKIIHAYRGAEDGVGGAAPGEVESGGQGMVMVGTGH